MPLELPCLPLPGFSSRADENCRRSCLLHPPAFSWSTYCVAHRDINSLRVPRVFVSSSWELCRPHLGLFLSPRFTSSSSFSHLFVFANISSRFVSIAHRYGGGDSDSPSAVAEATCSLKWWAEGSSWFHPSCFTQDHLSSSSASPLSQLAEKCYVHFRFLE